MNVEFALKAVRQIFDIFDLDLCLQSHIGNIFCCCNLHTTYNHCAYYEHP